MKKYNITVNGNTYEVEVEEVTGFTATPAAPKTVTAPVVTPVAPKAAPAAPKAPAATGSESVTAPMPGTILDVKVKVGDTVTKGQTMFILEAMKMENEIPAPCDGVVATVDTTKGSTVASGAVLATLN